MGEKRGLSYSTWRRIMRPRKGPAAPCSLRRAWVPRAVRVAGSSTNEWVPTGEPLVPPGRRPDVYLCPTRAPRARRLRPAIGPSGIPVRPGAPWRRRSQTLRGAARLSARRLLLLPRTDGPDTGGGPAVLTAATTEGTGP